MFATFTEIHEPHEFQSGRSWLTDVRPDYKFARSDTLFTVKPRYDVQNSYQDIGQRDLTKIVIENPSVFGYPTEYVPAPLGEVAYLIPRSGNQPSMQGSYGGEAPPIPPELVPVRLGGKMVTKNKEQLYLEALLQRQSALGGALGVNQPYLQKLEEGIMANKEWLYDDRRNYQEPLRSRRTSDATASDSGSNPGPGSDPGLSTSQPGSVGGSA